MFQAAHLSSEMELREEEIERLRGEVDAQMVQVRKTVQELFFFIVPTPLEGGRNYILKWVFLSVLLKFVKIFKNSVVDFICKDKQALLIILI